MAGTLVDVVRRQIRHAKSIILKQISSMTIAGGVADSQVARSQQPK